MRPLPVLAVVLALGVAGTAAAHERVQAGAFEVEIGWGVEPAYTGVANSVDVTVRDRAGRVVADPRARLTAEVRLGGEVRVVALEPADGAFAAALVPTRPGTYALHVSGMIDGKQVDAQSTCSASTFACVVDAAEAQFPVADPSSGQLAARAARAERDADEAHDAARTARWVAIAALVVASLAVGLALRRRRGAA